MERITASLEQLKREVTAHAQGIKQVFMRNDDTSTPVTQVAYGTFSIIDYCELHLHPTMEEYFYFLKGTGLYVIGNQKVILEPGVFVRIPAGVLHRLESTGIEPLEYVYFGVATA